MPSQTYVGKWGTDHLFSDFIEISSITDDRITFEWGHLGIAGARIHNNRIVFATIEGIISVTGRMEFNENGIFLITDETFEASGEEFDHYAGIDGGTTYRFTVKADR